MLSQYEQRHLVEIESALSEERRLARLARRVEADGRGPVARLAHRFGVRLRRLRHIGRSKH
jgi:hypothetical protein